MKILLFGVVQDIIGDRTLNIDSGMETELKTVLELKQFLIKKYPPLNTLTSLAVAINMEYASDERTIQPMDEIALIPPVSGG
ncbi:molybdopterin converting factor subunit 1 [Robiginitalea sp.]|jgi:molybdopterin synthase sulfur carrier subunit|nr:molybdopterin converting factor subunit 1 [Robiginitalea sp.]